MRGGRAHPRRIFAFAGGALFLATDSLLFERADVPGPAFDDWLAWLPRGTIVVAASAYVPAPTDLSGPEHSHCTPVGSPAHVRSICAEDRHCRCHLARRRRRRHAGRRIPGAGVSAAVSGPPRPGGGRRRCPHHDGWCHARIRRCRTRTRDVRPPMAPCFGRTLSEGASRSGSHSRKPSTSSRARPHACR